MPIMMTISQAAAETGLSYHCIRQLILSGQFSGYIKSGTKYYINRDLFVSFLNGGAIEDEAREHILS